jgi:hypothetical protein
MVGLILMAFTPWGNSGTPARFLACGFLGCFVTVATAFLVRQPGGIAPGMVGYSAVLGFVVSALVGVLKPFWFTETVRGRKPDAPAFLWKRLGYRSHGSPGRGPNAGGARRWLVAAS